MHWVTRQSRLTVLSDSHASLIVDCHKLTYLQHALEKVVWKLNSVTLQKIPLLFKHAILF